MKAREKRKTKVKDPVGVLPDILKPKLRLVFCGINPGMRSAMVGMHFANRTNRFWRVLHRSGFTSEELLPQNAVSLLRFGLGLTSAVDKPTVSASELARSDFVNARPGFERKMQRYRPQHLVFLGKPAYSAMFGQSKVSWGRQAKPIGGSVVWVLPNPSGLNRAFTLEALVLEYRKLFEALDH